MAKHDNRMPIQTALGYVEEARAASRDWRAKSWRDHEMYDGDQWTRKTASAPSTRASIR